MEMEDKSKYKSIKKLIKDVKTIPSIIAFINFIYVIFAYFGYNFILLNYIGGISLLTVLFLYRCSYALHFCSYHRLFIHYIVVNNILNIYDEYIGIPVEDIDFLLIHIIIAFCFISQICYKKFICHEQSDN